MENNIVIISLGGSVIVPDSIDIVFLKKVRKLITELNGIKKFAHVAIAEKALGKVLPVEKGYQV